MQRRLFTLLIAAAAISAAALGYLYLNQQTGRSAAGIAIGGPIHLTNQDGVAFDSASLAGKPYAVFFGYTHCPEVCPTTLTDISLAMDTLGDKGKDFVTLFVTIDPDRDTPPVMKEYLSNFTAKTVGLSGTPEQIAQVAKEYRVFYKKEPTSDGDYTMDHTAVVYLIDRKGNFRGVISYADDQKTYAEKIADLLSD